MSDPKTLYLRCKNVLKGRNEVDEKTIVRPYNYKLKKFVTKSSEFDYDIFHAALSYFNHILLKRSTKLIIEQYEKKLEKKLLKYFHSYSVHRYYKLINRKLPEELHNRALLEAMNGDEWCLEYLKDHQAVKKHRANCRGQLSKPKEIINYLIDNPNANDEEIIKSLYKRGILINKNLIMESKQKYKFKLNY